MKIDIVVPTLNRVPQLEYALLTSTLQSSGKHTYHYIFVVDTSDTVTRDFILSGTFKDSVVIHDTFEIVNVPDKCGNVHAVMAGIDKCQGDYISFLSDDMSVVGADWDIRALQTLETCDFATYTYTDVSGKPDDFSVFGIPYGIGGMVRREFAQTFPMLDRNYRYYYSDPDLALRMLLAQKLQRPCGVVMCHYNMLTPHAHASGDEERFYKYWGIQKMDILSAHAKMKDRWLK